MPLAAKSKQTKLRKRPMAVVRQIGLFSREIVERSVVEGKAIAFAEDTHDDRHAHDATAHTGDCVIDPSTPHGRTGPG